jgi:glyoxylase-like metal-dependent hydrolase (beta-lactamase superfamily II)
LIPKPAHTVADDVIRIHAPLPFPEPDHINCYVIRVDHEHVLVDTGVRGSGRAIEDALARFDIAIDRVLLTHGHPDHWGLARRYAAVALAHPDIRSQLKFSEQDPSSVSLHWLPPGREIAEEALASLVSYGQVTDDAPEVEPIHEGDRLGDWEVLVTPGHAPGHVCLYRDSDRLLIAGDHLLPEVTPNIHITGEMPDAVADYLDSLRRVGELDVRLVLPAHGEPFTDAAGRAAELIAHHQRRLAQLEGLLQAGGPTGTARLAEGLFSGLQEPTERLLAEMETYAHLEHLRLRGRVSLASGDTWTAEP